MTDPIFAALGQALADQERATDEAIASAVDQLAVRFLSTLDQRFKDLPTPKDGEPGQDGIDRVLVLPRYINGPDQRFERNEVAAFKGGIWQAVRAGQGDPDHDPSAWQCLVPGVAGIEAREDWAKRELIFGFRMSDGHLNETRARMLPGLLPADWEDQGIGIIAGDIVRDGDFERTALKDGADPANAQDWSIREIRGRRGRPGETAKGEQGKPGPGLTGLSLARDQVTGQLAILPAFADPDVQADPILVDILVNETGPARRAIVGFAGKFDRTKSYGRGDVVAAPGPALFLSLKPDNRAALDREDSWERMV